MATGADPKSKLISASELDAVLEKARVLGWRRLALFGPQGVNLRDGGVPKARTFFLREPLGTRISKVASLTGLTTLHLGYNQIGPDGVHALAALTQLTALDLSYNQIGDGGAHALAVLTRLTALDLSNNHIGASGAGALTALTGLTSLDLNNNHIGFEGASALGVLTALTSLDLSYNRIGPESTRALAALTRLTSLNLAYNQLGAEGARALVALTRLISLDLSDNRIGDDGARALASLGHLTSLDLGGNQIGNDGARALTSLSHLTSLDLGGNQIGDDGARALASLTRLTSLDLGANQIGDESAHALAALTSLTSLDLGINQIGDDGARALAALTGLTSLDLGANQIGDDGARALATLTGLSSLGLGANQIGNDGARALAALPRLTSLHLWDNQIGDDGARALAALTTLSSLYLGGNQIGDEGARALLDAWCDAPASAKLRIDLTGNRNMKSLLPPEVLELGDAQSILAAYRRYRDARRLDELRPLNEARLVVVGNEAVGKTSLIRYLVHGESRDPDEKKTPGTAIHEKIEVSAWSVHQSPVRVNVWDFGGQEIMRGTHRFFLTERSLYLLVLEDRREDDRSIYEWLEIIAQRGGNSPVIIVVNKSDSDVPQRRLDEARLRRAYPVIEGCARTSCNAGPAAAASIAGLRTLIAATLSESTRLKHVRDPIPQSWLRVKDAIAALARERSVLPVSEFERLCEGDATTRPSERISDPDEQSALLRLLRDLGVVVAHGLRRDAPAAWREITVLDPNWLTGAIYALINSPTVRDQGGQLGDNQLEALLDAERYPPRWHELILGMMQEPELGLCLPIAHGSSRTYLLPDALPVSEPDTGVWPADALRFRFQYSLLPTGFIPRFIVEAHRSLTDKPTWWRTGVVLGAEGCRILVRGDTTRNRVEIHVVGSTGRRAALSVVRNYFDAVHRYYAKLSFKGKVPLPEQPEVGIGYDHLVKLEHDEGLDYKFLPEDANRKYSVRELLEGVRDDGARRRRRHAEHSGDIVLEDLDEGLAAPRPPRPVSSPYRGKIDFGILTIREDENSAVLRRFAKVTMDERQRRYRIRSLALPGGGTYTLAVLRCLEQGNTDAQATAHALLEDLAPRFVLVVGIAGAVPSPEFSLGDVVVSSRIMDFSVEAVIRDKDREYALGGGPLHPDAARLAADVSSMIVDGELDGWNSPDAIKHSRPAVDLAEDRLYGDKAWKESVHEKIGRHFTAAPRPPLATTGAIASSDRLMKDDETLSVWLKIARQVVAVEMESAGIYKATHGRAPFLAIRGISDVVGFKRSPDWTTYACETAAAFAHAFLRTQPIVPIARP
jgi:internalin A